VLSSEPPLVGALESFSCKAYRYSACTEHCVWGKECVACHSSTVQVVLLGRLPVLFYCVLDCTTGSVLMYNEVVCTYYLLGGVGSELGFQLIIVEPP
jgi:hypothetical protein